MNVIIKRMKEHLNPAVRARTSRCRGRSRGRSILLSRSCRVWLWGAPTLGSILLWGTTTLRSILLLRIAWLRSVALGRVAWWEIRGVKMELERRFENEGKRARAPP